MVGLADYYNKTVELFSRQVNVVKVIIATSSCSASATP
jgi:hypothetical protein